MSGDTIGMMEGAFFVGRGELLSWANEAFSLGLTKVEQCATGALHCQIIDAIFPGTVSMSKVKWGAKHDYEFVENFKILQQALAKNEIKRYIDVDKLIKAKYQDNLELLQWMKRYYDINYNGEPYDAVGRRKGQDLYYILGGGKVSSQGGASRLQPKSNVGAVKQSTSQPQKLTTQMKTSGSGAAAKASGSMGSGDMQVKALQGELQEMKMNMDTLEKERDFYFAKLRDIEVLLQANPVHQNPLTENILKILYASEEEKVTINDDGSLRIEGAGGDVQMNE
eukprot:403341594